ncbi:MAG: hypothetical protein K2H02_05365, partial [Anaeroplasmataceae bacterium]|nr:hypothetical protein [Anaeroplasmataceae bacterium]
KYLFALPALLLALALVSCGNKTDNKTDDPDKKPPVEPVDPVEPTVPTYKATVLYPNGKAVTDTRVQWCAGTVCKTPVKVDNSGVAALEMEDTDGGYYIHIQEGAMPEGYTYNPNIYTTDASNREITIQLLKLETASSGDGKVGTPYQVGEGAYNINVPSKGEYPFYVFTAPTAGTYVIESLAVDMLATTVIDAVLLTYTSNEFSNSGRKVIDTGGVGKNFKHEVTLAANETLAFAISFNSSKDLTGKDVAAEFDFTITKK